MIIKDYSYYSSYDVGKNKSFYTRKKAFIVFAVFAVILFALLLKLFIPNSTQNSISSGIISPLAQDLPPNPPTPVTSVLSIAKNNDLREIVNNTISKSDGLYGIAIINLKTGQQFFLNEHEKFESASLYKLWVMAAVYRKIEEEKLTLDQIISSDIKKLNESFKIQEELAEQKDGTISLSVRDALKAMITRSDNYSALLLASNLRLSNIQRFLNDHGLTESRVGTVNSPPTITAYDASLFLNKLYNGEFANVQNSENMLTLLKGQVLNSKIPKLLPINTTVGHKTGELGNYTHDAGIVFAQNGDYIIVILTKTSSVKTANEKIAQISKDVYEYFNSLK